MGVTIIDFKGEKIIRLLISNLELLLPQFVIGLDDTVILTRLLTS